MKQNISFTRYTILWIVLLCYLLPVSSLGVFSLFSTRWEALNIGLILTFVGTLAIFWILSRWELRQQSASSPSFSQNADFSFNEPQEKSNAVPAEQLRILQDAFKDLESSLEETLQTNNSLHSQVDDLLEDIDQLKNEAEEQQERLINAQREYDHAQQTSIKQLEQQQAHIRGLQETIADQRMQVEKRQQHTGLLESKVNDLTYEIKTLLQLAEAHSGSLYPDTPVNPPQVHTLASLSANLPKSFIPQEDTFNVSSEKQIKTSDEASQQLKRCLDIAQKITGSHRFNAHISSFLDSTADSFALDLRRLCDSLRSENNSTILLYSPKENQLLFVNNQVKMLTGWSPEKFTQNFSQILQDDTSWKQGIASLAMRSESQIKMTLKTRGGQEVAVNGNLGMIPTGIFRYHTIAILY